MNTQRIKIYCPTNNVVYDSIRQASRHLNIWEGAIRQCLRCGYSTRDGFIFTTNPDLISDEATKVSEIWEDITIPGVDSPKLTRAQRVELKRRYEIEKLKKDCNKKISKKMKELKVWAPK